MTIAEYRKLKGLKQTELAEELRDICPGIDAALISKIENGVCRPSIEVEAYINAASDDLQAGSEGLYGIPWVNSPPDLKTGLKTEIPTEQMEVLYRQIEKASSKSPATRDSLSRALGITDREVRDRIQDLRNSGCWIYSSSNSNGYWLCEDEQQKEILLRSFFSRQISFETTVWSLTHLEDPFKAKEKS